MSGEYSFEFRVPSFELTKRSWEGGKRESTRYLGFNLISARPRFMQIRTLSRFALIAGGTPDALPTMPVVPAMPVVHRNLKLSN